MKKHSSFLARINILPCVKRSDVLKNNSLSVYSCGFLFALPLHLLLTQEILS